MNRLTNFLHNVGEQFGDLTRAVWPMSWQTLGTRFMSRQFGLRFWNTNHPIEENSLVNFNYMRSLYRNDGANAYGAGFAKPIVDLQVGFIGIPTASVDSDSTNEFLNECLTDFWVDEIQQIFRDAIRDSKAIVRIYKPDVLDPLMTLDEARHCRLELIAPERVDIERNPINKNIIERALIRHRMLFVLDDGNPANGQDPTTEEHDVLEIIDRQQYRFFDQTTNEWITDMTRPNRDRMVPLLEIYNEWDTALQGGQSDLETVIPFINAFHDLLQQGLAAHKYHSTPKLKMKLADVGAFIKANFPEIWNDATGSIVPNAEVNWNGREILFMQVGDDSEFLEARSVLGDTKTLAEFLIDCICIASQTPEWAFMRVDSGSANSDRNAQTVPFVKKIDRKRRMFTKTVQELLKMALVMNDLIPVRARISWEMVRDDDAVVRMQAFQQLVMGLEVARERGEISDETYRRMVSSFLPAMKSPAKERRDAESDPAPPQQPLALPPVAGGPQGKNE